MIRAALGLIALLAPLGAAHAEPATTQFENWLATFNTGDKAAIQKFYGEHLGDPDALTARNLREETCGFDLARVEEKRDK